MGQGRRLRRVYTTGSAASLLGVDPATLRKRAERGAIKAFTPRSGPNPLREWLFDAEELDARCQAPSTTCLWIEDPVRSDEASGDGSMDGQETLDGDHLVTEYRDQLDVLNTEVAVEREHRLIAEKQVIEVERDSALRELRRVERAFRALAAEVVEDERR